MENTTFGKFISQTRKDKGMSLKDLATFVKREDGIPISPQYLNDIEHNRRSPTSDHLVKEFADALDIAPDWLYYLAGRIPQDIRGSALSEKEVSKAMKAFRKTRLEGT